MRHLGSKNLRRLSGLTLHLSDSPRVSASLNFGLRHLIHLNLALVLPCEVDCSATVAKGLSDLCVPLDLC